MKPVAEVATRLPALADFRKDNRSRPKKKIAVAEPRGWLNDGDPRTRLSRPFDSCSGVRLVVVYQNCIHEPANSPKLGAMLGSLCCGWRDWTACWKQCFSDRSNGSTETISIPAKFAAGALRRLISYRERRSANPPDRNRYESNHLCDALQMNSTARLG